MTRDEAITFARRIAIVLAIFPCAPIAGVATELSSDALFDLEVWSTVGAALVVTLMSPFEVLGGVRWRGVQMTDFKDSLVMIVVFLATWTEFEVIVRWLR